MGLPQLGIRLLPLFVPLAAAWVRMREREILAEGVPLNEEELADARTIGVARPECVRLQSVDRIRTFEHRLLMPLALVADGFFAQAAGLTLNHAIFIRSDHWRDRRLVAHELVHVAQYERMGGIRPFLRSYFRECLVPGYPLGPLEQEAIQTSLRVCGS
jgi:Domain of unknown function (DUF4157)